MSIPGRTTYPAKIGLPFEAVFGVIAPEEPVAAAPQPIETQPLPETKIETPADTLRVLSSAERSSIESQMSSSAVGNRQAELMSAKADAAPEAAIDMFERKLYHEPLSVVAAPPVAPLNQPKAVLTPEMEQRAKEMGVFPLEAAAGVPVPAIEVPAEPLPVTPTQVRAHSLDEVRRQLNPAAFAAAGPVAQAITTTEVKSNPFTYLSDFLFEKDGTEPEAVKPAAKPKVTALPAKTHAKAKSFSPKRVALFTLGTAVSAVVLWGLANSEALTKRFDFLSDNYSASTAAQAALPVTVSTQAPFVGGPDTLSAEAAGIHNAAVIYSTATDENGIHSQLSGGIVHYGNTALPGEPGNAVFFGHTSNVIWAPGSYNSIFTNLDKLKTGDRITIVYAGRLYTYEYESRRVVSPKNLSVLGTSATPEITLIGCWPVGFSWSREVITARQISPAPASGAATPGHLPQI